MNENSSKQAILSIIGIAILVIAVVGVSFAFFTYSKEGTTNNVITTGSITFAYNETKQLSITNAFPQTPTEGKGNDTFTFNVTGTIPSSSGAVSYTVNAIAGDAVAEKNRMDDSEINVYVTATGGGVVTGKYGSENGAVAGDSSTGFQIASGTIAADGTQYTHNYTMTMWVNETVTISDTDASATYRASDSANGGDNTNPVYTDMYYSLKVNVTASA